MTEGNQSSGSPAQEDAGAIYDVRLFAIEHSATQHCTSVI